MFLKPTDWLDWVGGAVTSDLTPFANDPAAGESLAAMRDGKWRKARDAAKTLCKNDRARYLPLLVEANAGLAREMIGKGLLKDAVTVIDYLATIAPPERVAKLRSELASTTPSGTGGSAGGGEIHWAVALRVAGGAAAGNPIPPEELAAIDALVTDGFSPPQGAGEAADRLAAELAAVRDACAATGDGRWDEAKESLRALPHDSVFRHWRMFLRGARHAFGEEREMARKCFADLPPQGALARAARTLDPDLPGHGPTAPDTARVPFFLAATGQPASWAAAILDAEAAGKAGKAVRAYRELSKAMKGAFPEDRPGLACLLTESVLPFSRSMSDADFDDAFDLLNAYGRENLADSPNAVLTVVREACISIPENNAPGELERTWGSVLREWSRRDGAEPQRDAVVWLWLGETLARLETEENRSSPRRDFLRARKVFEKAVAADPENPNGWLAFLDLLEKSGDTKEHNRMLGELVTRFPANKKILQLAGNEALDRKTYVKALKNLRAALDLDPLDRQIKCSVAIALDRQALDLRKKGKSASAVWDELEPLLEDRPGHAHFMLSRWIARLRRGLLETDAELADAALAAAEKLAPSALERLFLEEKLREAFRLPQRKSLEPEWRAQVLKRPPDWKDFARIFPLADFSGAFSLWSDASWGRSVKKLDLLISAMVKPATEKHFPPLTDFLEHSGRLLSELGEDSRDLLEGALETILMQIEGRMTAGPVAGLWLQLTYLLALEASGRFVRVSRTAFFERLDQIIAHAEKSGESACLTKARALRERIASEFETPDSHDSRPSGPPPDLVDMLADVLESMKENRGGSGKSGKKSTSRNRGGDQMDFFQ